MAIVLTKHILDWFRKHPGLHRSDQQGTRIICPNDRDHQLHAHEIGGQSRRCPTCPHCFHTLQSPVRIPGEDREVMWPSIAA